MFSFLLCLFQAVGHAMQMAGPMNPGAVMAPPQPQNPQGNGHGGSSLHGQANSPNDPTGLGMQQPQQAGPQSGAPNGTQQDGYYNAPTTSQIPNVAEAKFNAALNSGGGQQPISPHIQQNGYVPAQQSGQNNYGQQVTGNNAQNANQSNATGGVPGNNSQQAAGTWTGSSTLTYTQAMQPPDPRTLMPGGYCKYQMCFTL